MHRKLLLLKKTQQPKQSKFYFSQELTQFSEVPERPNFPKMEEQILYKWKNEQTFKKSLELTQHKKQFTFYDGPPFATGLPHYGHILAGTIKDVVCRYASQTGHYVERKFGWDCHGLPIEYVTGIVMKYSSEWEEIVERSGRWIDFKNDYKTMDLKFMESIWAVFKQLYEKGYVYKGQRIMPYSNACGTVLSNFEVQQNYKETNDPALYVTFPLAQDPETHIVIWTTTPWTLPSNLVVAVNPNFTYIKLKVLQSGKKLIIAECRLNELYKDSNEYEVLEKMTGQSLEQLSYIPLFNYFEDFQKDGAFKIYCADFVTDNTGTGLVHCAPGFGEDDHQLCQKIGILNNKSPPVPLNANGKFTKEVPDYEGVYVKDADKVIRQDLQKKGRILKHHTITHNYPFCWRSDTPLIYKAIDCWFIKVTDVKPQLIENNRKARWVPQFAQTGRFENWLQDAKDWCFSRNRFWGNPIPIWATDDFSEIICIGSINELKKLSGYTGEITDLHRENIDHM